MSQNNEKEIFVQSELSVKESSDIRKVVYKAKAGLDKHEAIERHIIDEYNRTRDEDEGEQEEG